MTTMFWREKKSKISLRFPSQLEPMISWLEIETKESWLWKARHEMRRDCYSFVLTRLSLKIIQKMKAHNPAEIKQLHIPEYIQRKL